jgi:putative nucleotide binding protein
MQSQPEERREEYAYVLDFMPTGKSFSNKNEPVAQLIGENWFTLLEVTPKPGTTMSAGERVYIGKAEREKVSLIKSRVGFDDLTQTAKNELQRVVSQIVKTNEKRFVDVFNTAGSLNIRQHSLELLPGIGKKHLEAILKARNEKKFESFEEINQRVSLLQEPSKLITERILLELQGTERFYMFTKPYVKREGRY